MTAPAVIACAGAPRDLGLDQGEALREVVRDEVHVLRRERGWLALLRPPATGSRSARVARDVGCHFPHAAERLDGLARAARVSQRALFAALARAHDLADAGRDGLLVAAAPERSAGGPLLARSLSGAGWVVRRSVPEHDHVSLELVRPSGVAGVAGLNARGLGAALATLPPRGADLAVCAAPAQLLVQDCLQRFDRVASALEWCERRPAGGHAEIVLADASGDLAIVELRGSQRRVHRPAEGVHIGLAAPARQAMLAKALAPHAALDRTALLHALGSHQGEEPERPCRHLGDEGAGAAIVIEPAARRLYVAAAHPCRAEADALASFDPAQV